MKLQTKRMLFNAWKECDINDKSTEFMLEYMQSVAGVDLDCVMSFLQKNDSWSKGLSELDALSKHLITKKP